MVRTHRHVSDYHRIHDGALPGVRRIRRSIRAAGGRRRATAFRRGERWAWWALLVGNTIALGSAMTYDWTVSAIGPFELTEYLGLALIWGTLAVTAPFRAEGRPFHRLADASRVATSASLQVYPDFRWRAGIQRHRSRGTTHSQCWRGFFSSSRTTWASGARFQKSSSWVRQKRRCGASRSCSPSSPISPSQSKLE